MEWLGRKVVAMDQKDAIKKLRDCAKGLLDVACELQRTERVEAEEMYA